MNDNIFSCSRFKLVFRKYFSENCHTMFLRILTLFGILVIVFALYGWDEAAGRKQIIDNVSKIEKVDRNSSNYDYRSYLSILEDAKEHSNDPLNTELILGFFIAFFSALYVGSTFMEHAGSKEERINIYLQPATMFEKYLVRWLFTILLFVIVYPIVFVLADLIRVAFVSLIYPGLPGTYPVNYSTIFSDLTFLPGARCFFITLFFALQSAFMLGSSVWHKNAFIKTAVSVVVLFFIIFWVGNIASDFGHVSANGADVKEDYLSVYSSNDNVFSVVYAIIFSVLTLFNWALTYVRMKENDIAGRVL
jgi:hypothetical protein